MRGKIFLSHRRAGASGTAARLYDRLAERFPDDRISFDTNWAERGEDIATIIERSIATADVVLVVIGKDWLGAREQTGQCRLDDPRDPERLEISAALCQSKIVIPVLVEAAAMPAAEHLPEDLQPLVHAAAVTVSHANFTADAARLIAVLDHILEDAAEEARRNRDLTQTAGPEELARQGATADIDRWEHDELIAEYDALVEAGSTTETDSYYRRFKELLMRPFGRYSGVRFFVGFLVIYISILVFLYFSLVGGQI